MSEENTNEAVEETTEEEAPEAPLQSDSDEVEVDEGEDESEEE